MNKEDFVWIALVGPLIAVVVSALLGYFVAPWATWLGIPIGVILGGAIGTWRGSR